MAFPTLTVTALALIPAIPAPASVISPPIPELGLTELILGVNELSYMNVDIELKLLPLLVTNRVCGLS